MTFKAGTRILRNVTRIRAAAGDDVTSTSSEVDGQCGGLVVSASEDLVHGIVIGRLRLDSGLEYTIANRLSSVLSATSASADSVTVVARTFEFYGTDDVQPRCRDDDEMKVVDDAVGGDVDFGFRDCKQFENRLDSGISSIATVKA